MIQLSCSLVIRKNMTKLKIIHKEKILNLIFQIPKRDEQKQRIITQKKRQSQYETVKKKNVKSTNNSQNERQSKKIEKGGTDG